MNRIYKAVAAVFMIAVMTGSLFTGTVGAAPISPVAALPVSSSPVELSLKDAIRMALQNNSSLTIAVADKEAAKGALTSANAGFWPTVGLNHSDTSSWSATSTTGLDQFVANNYVSINWTLFSGFRISAQAAQARLNVDSTTWGVALAAQQLRLEATNAYFGLLASAKLVELNQEAVDQLGQHLKDAQLQYDVGTVAKTDVLRSEVELANAVQALIKAQNAYEIAMATLNDVIGLPLTTIIKPKEALGYGPVNVSLPDSTATALKQRPEAFQGVDSLKSSEAGVTVARAGYLPSVSASYRSSWNDTNFPGINSASQGWSVGVSASWTAFDAGLTAGKVKQANEGVNKSRAQLKKTQEVIRLEVQASYLNLLEAEKLIETSRVAVSKAEEDFKISQIRYSAGAGTNLDVLDSHVALTQARTNYVQALYAYNTSKAKLETAMGLPANSE